jgi:cob(I)alamin adenosyltransferase
MKIYTKTGDTGETGLFGGQRVSKDNLRIDAYGTVDELNAFIGLALCETVSAELKADLKLIQNRLFTVGSDLATPLQSDLKNFVVPRTEDIFYLDLEKRIDFYSIKLEELRNFILPGGSKSASILHVCRTVCRRSERLVVNLMQKEELNKNIVIFMNRLSDFFFVVARYENFVSGIEDVKWEK